MFIFLTYLTQINHGYEFLWCSRLSDLNGGTSLDYESILIPNLFNNIKWVLRISIKL